MTEILLLLYAIDVMRGLAITLITVGVLSAAAVASLVFTGAIDSVNYFAKYARPYLWVPITCFALLILMPSKQTMHVLLGARTLQITVTTPLGEKAYKAIEQALDKALALTAK